MSDFLALEQELADVCIDTFAGETATVVYADGGMFERQVVRHSDVMVVGEFGEATSRRLALSMRCDGLPSLPNNTSKVQLSDGLRKVDRLIEDDGHIIKVLMQ